MFAALFEVLEKVLTRRPLLSGFLLGLSVPFAFAPFYWFWLMPCALAGLFVIQYRLPVRLAIKSGFVFGFAAFGVGASWVYVSLHTFGGMPMLLAGFCVVVFVGILSLYPALAALLYNRISHSNIHIQLLCIMPAFWVLIEVLRNYLFGGFPWLETGYSQSGIFLDVYAAITGVHGLSLIVAIQAGCLASICLCKAKNCLIPVVILMMIIIGGKVLSWHDWTQPRGDTINVAMVQSVIPIETKWNPEKRKYILDKYFRLSSQFNDAELIIWPEAAIASSLDQLDADFFEQLQRLNKPLLAGFVERGYGEKINDSYNAAVLFAEEPDIYRKRHLVPFGEYMPLRFMLDPITHYLNIPNSSMSPWNEYQSPMYFADHRLGIGICFEEAFPADMRNIAKDADVLINLSEDAWFGRSLGPHQRLQMAQIRAIETGRPSLRSSNTALTSLIDHKGRIVKITKSHVEEVLQVIVQPRQGLTPYMRYGDFLVFLILAVMCLPGAFSRWRSR